MDELKNKSKNPLGKGLAALLGDLDYIDDTNENINQKGEGLAVIDIKRLKPGKMQPRLEFNAEKMLRLVESIKSRGVLQPILIRSIENNEFEIIAGERRWRAAKEAGLTEIPIRILECSDEEALELGLIENLQRSDLNIIEEAESLKRLMNEFGKTQEEIAKSISKSRSYVANVIRLDILPDYIKDLIRKGRLSAGHARALITTDNIDDIVDKVLSEQLNVRETEDLAKKQKNKMSGTKVEKTVDPDLLLVAKSLEEKLGLPTKIDITKKGGCLKMTFETYEQLDFVVSKIQNLI